LIIGLGGQVVTVKPPIRITFDAQKSITGGLNKLNLVIYNLQEKNRLKLVKYKEEIKNIPLFFKVGYKDRLETVFKGSVHRGTNTRTGPDRLSTIECLDGGFDFINSFTSKTIKGKDNAINAILSDMPNTGKGKVTSQNQLIRPKVLVGNSAELINQQINADETWYIEDEQLYIIKNNEIVSSYVPLVSAKTGLTNTPQRENQKVTFETLMNPTIKIGGQVKLESVTAPHLNDIYKIETLGFNGDNYGSTWHMTVTGIKNNNFTVL
jgi:hypothetical protein